MKKWGMILLALVLAMSLTACGPKADGARNAPAEDAAAGGSAGNAENPRKVVYVPLWMTPNSVVYYDAELNRTIEQGADLTDEEINSREDIRAVGMYGDTLAEPDTKVEYDLHGFLQNIYYKTDDGSDYQLAPPDARG